MGDAIKHRGPDDSGIWRDENSRLGLVHRRLAIIDLTQAGHQPMISHSSRFVLIFNGEIYNHRSIRDLLTSQGAAPEWRGQSDTETLLAAFEHWGVVRTLKMSVGMFAFALWDCQEKTLTLGRDRFGEKPLYYGWQSNSFIFASELSAIAANQAFERQVDYDAASQMLRHGYIASPRSIWRGIYKLPPASILTLRNSIDTNVSPHIYWSFPDMVLQRQEERSLRHFDEREAASDLEELLIDAVRGQLLSDVPLGALLSGGIDSSLVVSLMQKVMTNPVHTFSIGFSDRRFDESSHAERISEYLGTKHTTLIMTEQDVLDVVPRMASVYDEPFGDSSQLATYLVMGLARRDVTVALSGDAGDEIFGGYNRYTFVPRLWSFLRYLPKKVRQSAARALLSLPPEAWDRLAGPLKLLTRQERFGDRLHKMADRLSQADSLEGLYAALTAEWDETSVPVTKGAASHPLLDSPEQWPGLRDPVEKMMAVDTLSYLPDDILVKVDRAAMAVSLETRTPFLDHRVAEFAWSLPMSAKIDSGVGKKLLREVLGKYVPRELVDRPKMGFGVPLDSWLRGPLRQWAADLLSPTQISRQGVLNHVVIDDIWTKELRGTHHYGARLWNVLMFQAWCAEQGF